MSCLVKEVPFVKGSSVNKYQSLYDFLVDMIGGLHYVNAANRKRSFIVENKEGNGSGAVTTRFLFDTKQGKIFGYLMKSTNELVPLAEEKHEGQPEPLPADARSILRMMQQLTEREL